MSHALTASNAPAHHPQSEDETVHGLLAALASITDPRHSRGVRHHLTTVLAVAVIATLAGARNYRELADQAADLSQDLLWLLGASYSPRHGHLKAPSGSTLRRVLIALDAAELDRTVGAWLRDKAAGQADTWAIALDG
ncbi:transposase family protein, partial [Nocardiopsis oceani]